MSNRLSLDFNRYKPKQTYTFEVEFSKPGSDDKSLERLTTAVASLNLVKVPVQVLQDPEMGFGLYWNIIPVHDIDSKELKIVFEETDDMFVSTTFGSTIVYGNTYRDLWEKADYIITIKYFNEYKYDDINKKSAERIERYRAIVKDIQHPTYSRTGNVDKLDITVTFKVMLDDVEVTNADGSTYIIAGDHTNYMNNVTRKLESLTKLFKGSAKPIIPPHTEPAPSNPSTPTNNPAPQTARPAGQSTQTPATQQEKQQQAKANEQQSDNKPNTGSGRSKKSFPKLKRLTNGKNYKSKQAAGDNNYFNNTGAYYGTIFKVYKEWLAANNKKQDIKSAREFLIGSGVLGKTYDDTTCHMCAAGTNLQMSLAADVEKYTSYGNGADVAKNYADRNGLDSVTIEFNEKDWTNAKKKIEEMCSSGQYVVSLNYNDGQYGHAFTVADGVSMSDYQHAGTAGLGVSNKAHGGCKSITITKVA